MTDSNNFDDPPGSVRFRGREVDKAIRRHDRMLVRWLARKFGDIETAKDVAQSAYLRVWRYAQSNEIENLQALLFKTAANLAANEFRARKRRRVFAPDPAAGESESAIDLLASDSPSPEMEASNKEEIAALLVAIDSLPAQAKSAFVLSRFEEKSYREIAAILNVSESSVEKYIISALRSLRAASRRHQDVSNIIPLAGGRTRR